MSKENITTSLYATSLYFLGFPGLGGYQTLLFIPILSSYAMTILLDVVIIIIVSTRKGLQFPMYFFIKNFLLSEMILITSVIPNMLRVIWMGGATISVGGCLAQSYFFLSSGACECYLLAAMSYDRYLAICKPLHYSGIMDPKLQYLLAIICWMLGFLSPLGTLSLLIKLKFCGQNVIDHYFCDLAPIITFACSDTSVLQTEIFIISFPIVVIPFVLVLVSYASIFVVVLRMPSMLGRKKAFSTCSTHLSVVGMFYGTLIINYFIPVRGHSIVINKMIAMIFIVITPLFNPIIYSLRNKGMHAVINGCIKHIAPMT